MMCVTEHVKKSRMIFASLLNKMYFKQLLLTDITYQEACLIQQNKMKKEGGKKYTQNQISWKKDRFYLF